MAVTASAPRAFSQQFKLLHVFNGLSQGGGLYGGLILDQAGTLYGTAQTAGTPTYGYGTAFALNPNGNGSWRDTVLHDFRVAVNYSRPDGLNPQAGLIADAAGNLYGTTFYGGEPDMGTVFKLAPDGNGNWKETILHEFGGESGRYPDGGLIFDSAGNLYGTTYGVPYHCGTVYKLSPTSGDKWTETVLYDFGPSSGGNDGCESTSTLVFDASGNLYGTTSGGGGNLSYGLVFELSPQSTGEWKETVLHRFSAHDGNIPYSGLTLDAKGNLYGTTFGGGSSTCPPLGCGTVYELEQGTNGTWTEKVIYRFDGFHGENPIGGVIFDSAGNLYGGTDYGGGQNCNMGCGVIFELTPTRSGPWTQTILHNFEGVDGWGNVSNLIFDSTGNLYGTTITGGGANYCCGVAFEMKP